MRIITDWLVCQSHISTCCFLVAYGLNWQKINKRGERQNLIIAVTLSQELGGSDLRSDWLTWDKNFKFPALWCPFSQCGNTASGLAGLYLNLMLSSPMRELIFLSQSSSYTIELLASLITISQKYVFLFSQ